MPGVARKFKVVPYIQTLRPQTSDLRLVIKPPCAADLSRTFIASAKNSEIWTRLYELRRRKRAQKADWLDLLLLL